MRSVWVGVAGFYGAVARYQLDSPISRHAKGTFPWGTSVVNLTRCSVLGNVAASLAIGLLRSMARDGAFG